jgi:hypothetical protein
MEITRRSFLAGIGSVTVGLLFARKLDAVLDSLERDLAAEQQTPEQQPCAAEIVVMPQRTFHPERLVVPASIAPLFVIEEIMIGGSSQFVSSAGVPAELFAPGVVDSFMGLDLAPPGTAIRFRVRYIGSDPKGERFFASMIGRGVDAERRMMVLPIDSGVPIAA